MVKSSFTYEDAYALRIMEFEREMARKRLRPELPMQRKYTNTAPAAAAMREEQNRVRKAVYSDVINSIEDGEVVDLKSLSDRIGTTAQKLTNYMRPMVEKGYLQKLTMTKGSVSYLYMKTGKELEDE